MTTQQRILELARHQGEAIDQAAAQLKSKINMQAQSLAASFNGIAVLETKERELALCKKLNEVFLRYERGDIGKRATLHQIKLLIDY